MLEVNKIVDVILALDEGEEYDLMLDSDLRVSYSKKDNIFSNISFNRRNYFDDVEKIIDYKDVADEELEDVVSDAIYTLAAA